MKTAIIGLGVIGDVHYEVLKSQNKNIVALCDVREEKLSKFDDVNKYTDYKKMIDIEKPDVVHICTPHYLHAEMVIYALNKNVNVFCEKPLCIKKEDIPLILEAEKNSKAKLGVCFQNRYLPRNAYVKEFLSDKKIIGANASFSWCRGNSYYAQDAWRGTKEFEGGGVLINQAIHTIDIMCWFLGYPDYVTASVANLSLKGVIEVEDTAMIVASGNSNFTFLATNANKFDVPPQISIVTENDVIRIFDDKIFINNKKIDVAEDKNYFGKPCYGSGHATIIEHFYYCLENDEEFPITGIDGAKTSNFVLSCYESEGEKIKL